MPDQDIEKLNHFPQSNENNMRWWFKILPSFKLFMSCSILHYVLLPWLICLRYFLSMQYHQWSALPRKARANSLKHQLMSQRKTIYALVIIRQKHSLSENKWGMLKEKQYKDRNRMPAPREKSSESKLNLIMRTLNSITRRPSEPVCPHLTTITLRQWSSHSGVI